MSVKPGQRLSRYKIIEKIGEGGMGVVFRAYDDRLDRDVAIKVLRPHALDSEDSRRRFQREARALSRLNHPNIATVHDFDSQDDVDFIVMEHVAGETLGRKIVSGGLAESEVGRLGQQIAAALDEAHAHHVVHRDLKPGNILVTPSGQIKVLDFGLAKRLGQPGSTSQLDTESMVGRVGTLPYMAPEQILCERVDERTDLFALGAVLYEMATGRRAFPGTTVPQVTDAILHEKPTAPGAIGTALSSDLERILSKCLEKEPDRRYQSAREIAIELQRIAGPGVSAPLPPVRRRRPRLAAAAGLCMAAVGIGSVLWLTAPRLGRRLRGGHATKPISSLAVLPLENLTGDREQQYLVDGMHEELIANLSRIGALRVISRTSVMRYKDTTKALPEIARELGVDGIIEGSVLRADNHFRITVQLIRASTDAHLWANSYEGDLSDVLALQRRTAEAVARQVRVVVTPQERARLAKSPSADPAAHEAFLKGRFYLQKNNDEAITKARDFFEHAVAIDSTYAPAYAALGYPFLYSDLPPAESAARARRAAEKALELDGDLADAHIAKAEVLLYCDWAWKDVEPEIRRAIELDPNSAEAHHQYAHFLRPVGRLDESLQQAKIAVALDPLNLPIVGHLIGEYQARRDNDSVLVAAQRVLDLDPTYLAGRMAYAGALARLGRVEESIDAFQKISSSVPEGRDLVLGPLISVYARHGKRDEALKLLPEFRAMAERNHTSNFAVAAVLLAVGDKEGALSRLDAALQERDPGLTDIKINAAFDPLRSDPRFRAVVEKVGLPP